jgi:flavorubredoxin
METEIHEVGERIYKLSTFLPMAPEMGGGMYMNQYLVDAEQPLLFHCGMRFLFPLVSEAAARVLPLQRLRWISFGHVEADECGSMNQWLAAAPNAQVVHGEVGVMVQLQDLADRPPLALPDGGVLDLGGRRMRLLATPHLPHNWETIVMFEETTRTLLCGDVFTQTGPSPATTEGDVAERALHTQATFPGADAFTPHTVGQLERLAALDPRALLLMHGPAFRGDGAAQLRTLGQGMQRLYGRV